MSMVGGSSPSGPTNFYVTSEEVSARVSRVTAYARMSLGNLQVKIPYSNRGLRKIFGKVIIC